MKAGLSNYKLLEILKKDGYKDLPTYKQLSSRRYYLKNTILKELKANTKRGFFAWLEETTKGNSQSLEHNMVVLQRLLEGKNFMLLVTTKELLKNALNQAQITSKPFFALDTTYKLISCQFKFTTFITVNYKHQTADLAYLIHANEDADSYLFGLNGIKAAIKSHFDFDWVPKVRDILVIIVMI